MPLHDSVMGHQRNSFPCESGLDSGQGGGQPAGTNLPGGILYVDYPMTIETEAVDETFIRRKRTPPDTAVDITPMIDMTFQLLIFFMVTSTMQGNPPTDLPPSLSGGSIEVAKVINVVVRPAAVFGEAPQIEVNKESVNLEELKLLLEEQAGARANGIDVMILADRTMANGDLNEVEMLMSEIPGVTYHFGVQDRRN